MYTKIQLFGLEAPSTYCYTGAFISTPLSFCWLSSLLEQQDGLSAPALHFSSLNPAEKCLPLTNVSLRSDSLVQTGSCVCPWGSHCIGKKWCWFLRCSSPVPLLELNWECERVDTPGKNMGHYQQKEVNIDAWTAGAHHRERGLTWGEKKWHDFKQWGDDYIITSLSVL